MTIDAPTREHSYIACDGHDRWIVEAYTPEGALDNVIAGGDGEYDTSDGPIRVCYTIYEISAHTPTDCVSGDEEAGDDLASMSVVYQMPEPPCRVGAASSHNWIGPFKVVGSKNGGVVERSACVECRCVCTTTTRHLDAEGGSTWDEDYVTYV